MDIGRHMSDLEALATFLSSIQHNTDWKNIKIYCITIPAYPDFVDMTKPKSVNAVQNNNFVAGTMAYYIIPVSISKTQSIWLITIK